MTQAGEPTDDADSPATDRDAGTAVTIGETPVEAARMSTIAGLAGLTIATFAIRVPFMKVPMISDEGGYAYVAYFWSRGVALYRDLPFDRPQGIFLIYRAILASLGTDVVAMRVAAALCAGAILLAVFATARSLISDSCTAPALRGGAASRAGWIAATVFGVFSVSPSIEGFSANAELFANLPLVLAAYSTWKQRWLLAGLLAGVACLIKPSGVSALMLALAWGGLQLVPPRKLLGCVAAFAIAPLASVAHGLYVGFDAYFSSLVLDRLLSFSVVTSSAQTQWHRFTASTLDTASAWAAPAVLAALGALSVPRSVATFGGLWLLCSLAGMSLGGNWYWHYYIQLLPPLALLAGGARFGNGLRRWSFVALFALAIGRFAALDAPLWLLDSDQISLSLYRRAGYLYSQNIADFIDTRTQPSDSIYVAFSEAELYYLARRRAAVPEQLYWNQVQYNKHAFDAVLRAIEARRPAIVVWAQPVPPWITPEQFRGVLERGYRMVRAFGPIGVFERR